MSIAATIEIATVLEWLGKNKEWLFSGLGPVVLSGLVVTIFPMFAWLRRRLRKKASQNVEEATARGLLRETPQISARLKQILVLINCGRNYDKLTVSKVAQMMGSSSVGQVERYFEGIEDPPLSFLHAFSEHFGVQEAWLLHDEQQPFHQPEPFELHASGYLPYIEQVNPEEIYFVRSTSERGECAIVLKHDAWRYHVLDSYWHVSSHVGGTGTTQLVSLYKLIKTFREKDLDLRCSGQVLDEQNFSKLIDGAVFPGALLSNRNQNHDWWAAFADLAHEFPSSVNYAAWYGRSFMDAQEIVRNAIAAGNRAA
jgi:transcriptional regulator with XRE-family HTH domain